MDVKILLDTDDITRLEDYLDIGIGNIDDILIKIITQVNKEKNNS